MMTAAVWILLVWASYPWLAGCESDSERLGRCLRIGFAATAAILATIDINR